MDDPMRQRRGQGEAEPVPQIVRGAKKLPVFGSRCFLGTCGALLLVLLSFAGWNDHQKLRIAFEPDQRAAWFLKELETVLREDREQTSRGTTECPIKGNRPEGTSVW